MELEEGDRVFDHSMMLEGVIQATGHLKAWISYNDPTFEDRVVLFEHLEKIG